MSTTITSVTLIGLLPLLITSGTAILVMLSIALRRHHGRSATLTVAGLAAALLSLPWAADSAPQLATALLMIDGYALLFMTLVLACTLACAILGYVYLGNYPGSYPDNQRGNRDEWYLLLLLAAAGGLVLAMSNHFASLFIGLELLSVPTYGLIAYHLRDKNSLEAGIKYMVLSAAASAFLLFGMALLYAHTGTLEFARIVAVVGSDGAYSLADSPLLAVGIAFMLVGLGFKLSVVPFHLWTPDVYEGAPAPVGAFLATASKIAVFAVLVRFLVVASATHTEMLRDILAVIAVASIFVGNLLALTQQNFKRLLGYSSIAHFGYLLVAVVVGNTMGMVAMAVYLLTYVASSIGAFGVIALLSDPARGRDLDMIADYRGLYARSPALAIALTIMLLSLAGIPLTAGFIGKFFVMAAGVSAQLWWLLGAVVAGSAIALYYYLRVVVALYQPAMPQKSATAPAGNVGAMGAGLVLALAVLTVLLGIWPQPMLDWVHGATIAVLR